jgi:hypothetical protein
MFQRNILQSHAGFFPLADCFLYLPSTLKDVAGIVTCIPIARQRFCKHASTIERLFSVWSPLRPLQCNGAVNTPKTIWDNRRRCFPMGPCKRRIELSSIELEVVEKIRLETPGCRDMCLGAEEMN